MVTLGKPNAGPVQHQADMCVDRLDVAEAVGQPRLPWRGGQQISSAGDLPNALERVIDHRRQVVGRRAIGTQQHEVIDPLGVVTGKAVVDGPLDPARPHPQGRRPSGPGLGPLGGAQVGTGPRVGAIVPMRRRRCLGDLAA